MTSKTDLQEKNGFISAAFLREKETG